VTSLGEIELTVIKVRRGGRVTSPILDFLGIRRRRYSNELRMLLADMAARLSYGETRKQFREITGLDIPKRTIHSFVQEIGAKLGEASASRMIEEPIVVMADGTRTHSIYQTQNTVKVAISYDQDTGEKSILSVGVNKGWMEAQGRTPSDAIVVSDADEEISLYISHSDLQLDVVHAIRDSLYRMWMDGSARVERVELSEEMGRILYILVYSVRKYLEGGERKEVLSRRIESAVEELSGLADEMEERSYVKTAAFIRSHARFMVTFAKVALEKGIRMPYTSNAIERLMGEISRRCKHKWMSWSTNGLENLLAILLIRYAEERFYREFWQSYIHQSTYQ
jgi:transposase-like protein